MIEHAELFQAALDKTKEKTPFNLIAWVLMPDHFHLLIDPLHSDLSYLMKKIKLRFAYSYRTTKGLSSYKVWQRRFWDHIIRNESDLNKHLDYIHYNPVKHGLVSKPSEWKESSFCDFLKNGQYEYDWGTHKMPSFEGDFGE